MTHYIVLQNISNLIERRVHLAHEGRDSWCPNEAAYSVLSRIYTENGIDLNQNVSKGG